MKHLKKNTKRVLSLGLALLMVVSTMFVGGIQAKAEAGTTYEPYYDVEAGKVAGVPEIGTFLKAGDIIKAGDKVNENTTIYVLPCNFVEETEEWGYVQGEYLSKGEEVDIADVKTYLCDNPNGYTVANIEYESYPNGEDITIFLLAVDQPVKLESMELELDWSKIDAEIGGTLSLDTFNEGFIKNEKIDEESVGFYTCINVSKPNGEVENTEECTINADDVYSFELVYSLENGYYFSANAEDDITINDTLAESAFHWGRYSTIWDNNISITFEFTGAELVEKVNATTPSDPVVPPVEDDEEVVVDTYSLYLMCYGEGAIVELYEEIWDNEVQGGEWEKVELQNEHAYAFDIEAGKPLGEQLAHSIKIENEPIKDGATFEGWVRIELELVDGEYKTAFVPQASDKLYYSTAELFASSIDSHTYFVTKWSDISLDEYYEFFDISGNPPTEDEADKDPVVPPVEEETNDYAAKLENEAEVVDKITLTDDEKAVIESGEELEIILDFKTVGAEAVTEEQKAIVKELGDKKVGTFLEIDLTKKIGTYEAKVSETTGAVAITFELPADLKNTDTKVERTYYVVRYHDGKVDILDATYDEATGKITFETDKFSTYAVVYEDVAVKEPVKAPATGDTTNVAMYIMLLVCGAGILVASRKMNRI